MSKRDERDWDDEYDVEHRQTKPNRHRAEDERSTERLRQREEKLRKRKPDNDLR